MNRQCDEGNKMFGFAQKRCNNTFSERYCSRSDIIIFCYVNDNTFGKILTQKRSTEEKTPKDFKKLKEVQGRNHSLNDK